MKKLICIVLISWLPVFMLTANAMSLQMTTQSLIADLQTEASMPCHDKTDKQPLKAHNCMSCGFCAIATSIASTTTVPFLHIPECKSFKTSFVDDGFNSIDHAPAYRPPILN